MLEKKNSCFSLKKYFAPPGLPPFVSSFIDSCSFCGRNDTDIGRESSVAASGLIPFLVISLHFFSVFSSFSQQCFLRFSFLLHSFFPFVILVSPSLCSVSSVSFNWLISSLRSHSSFDSLFWSLGFAPFFWEIIIVSVLSSLYFRSSFSFIIFFLLPQNFSLFFIPFACLFLWEQKTTFFLHCCIFHFDNFLEPFSVFFLFPFLFSFFVFSSKLFRCLSYFFPLYLFFFFFSVILFSITFSYCSLFSLLFSFSFFFYFLFFDNLMKEK